MPNPLLSRSHRTMSGPTTRSNRTRVPVETPLRGRSRQGCWTCRIRRKKCDEQMDDHGLCLNCSRLGIQCIGWGERRPEWLKDPEKLKQFKQSMKNQIMARTRSSSDPIADPNISMASTQMVEQDQEELEIPASTAVLVGSRWETADDFGLSPVMNPPPYDPVSHQVIPAGLSPHLALSGSNLRPSSPSLTDAYDYRAFVEHVQVLADIADLPGPCALAVREIAALGLWKQDQLNRGCLSYRELVKRSSGIEQVLLTSYEDAKIITRVTEVCTRRQTKGDDIFQFMDFPGDLERHSMPNTDFPLATSYPFSGFPLQGPVQTEVWPGILLDVSTSPACLPPQLSAFFDLTATSDGLLTPEDPPQEYTVSPQSPATLPYLSALLFLHSVISGINRRVPEIISTSEEILDVLRAPGTGETIPRMQALLAITLSRCLSGRIEFQDMFSHIITTIDVDAARVSATALVDMMDSRYLH